jgi:NAD(P)-dependent dehydrogenase (short-subunit alcohol dehydrogenase family)
VFTCLDGIRTNENITQPPSAGASIERFAHYLQTAHAAAPGVKRHHLVLRAVLLIPSLSYQTSPIATIPPSSFADLFNTHLLHPILTIQAFLPLLTARLEPQQTDKPAPKVLVFTPSIISAINPPFHAPEATVCSAMAAFTEVLQGELRPLGVPVTHVQLGTFDFSAFAPSIGHNGSSRSRPTGLLPAPDHAESLTWPDAARQAYGRNYVSQSASAISAGRIRGMRGSSLRELHASIFDVIDGTNTSGVVRVGLGADIYGFVGLWVPRTLVAWMMGQRRVEELATWQATTPEVSEKSGSESGDFVAIPMEQSGVVAGADVWREN